MLYIGEKVGGGGSQRIDVALDPLEGTTLCAKAMPNAIAVIAMADSGSLLHAPDTYMDKIAIGGGYPDGIIDLDAPPEETIAALASAKGVKPSEITACILDRPRHAELIAALRARLDGRNGVRRHRCGANSGRAVSFLAVPFRGAAVSNRERPPIPVQNR